MRAAFLGISLALLAGCATSPKGDAAKAESAALTDTALTLPVPAPIYRLGDSFTYREGSRDDTLVVTAVEGGLVNWTDDWGATWVTTDDPSQPPRSEIRKPGDPPITREFSAEAATLFPLRQGRAVDYTVTSAQGSKAPLVERRSCTVGGRRRLTVPAGAFETWEIICRHGEYQDHFDYAPAIGAFVLARRESFLSVQRTELVAYYKAMAANQLAPVALIPPGQARASVPQALKPSAPRRPVASDAQPAAPAASTSEQSSPTKQAPPAETKVAAADKPPISEPAPPDKTQAPTPAPPEASSASAPKSSLRESPDETKLSFAGGYAVQLAAYPSYFEASRGWEAIRDRFPDLLHDFGPRVEDIRSPDGTRHIRLFVGPFDTETAANHFCGELRAQRQDCWVHAMR